MQGSQVLVYSDRIESVDAARRRAASRLEGLEWVGSGEMVRRASGGGGLFVGLAVRADDGTFSVVDGVVRPATVSALRDQMRRDVRDVIAVGKTLTFAARVRWDTTGTPVDLIKVDPRASGRGEWSTWKEQEAGQVAGLRPATRKYSGTAEFDKAFAALGERRIVVLGKKGTHGVKDFCRALAPDLAARRDVRSLGLQSPRTVADLRAALDGIDRDECGLVVIVRGGGSVTDLAPFHTADLARAVQSCVVDVAVGLGHSADATLADRAASLTSETPATLGRQLSAARARADRGSLRTRSRRPVPVQVPAPRTAAPAADSTAPRVAALQNELGIHRAWTGFLERVVVDGARGRLRTRYRRVQRSAWTLAGPALLIGLADDSVAAPLVLCSGLTAVGVGWAARRARRFAESDARWETRPADFAALGRARTRRQAVAALRGARTRRDGSG